MIHLFLIILTTWVIVFPISCILISQGAIDPAGAWKAHRTLIIQRAAFICCWITVITILIYFTI